MRWSYVLILIVALFRSTPAHAAGDEQFVEIYLAIQDADALLASDQSAKAKQKYLDALGALTIFQKVSPEWNPKAVQFRLAYVNEKIAGLKTVLLESEKPAPGEKEKTAPVVADPTAPLKETIAQLEKAKSDLAAKLQEALSAQPAATDPRELVKAEERIKALEKVKGLTEENLLQAQSKILKMEQDLKVREVESTKVGVEVNQLKAAIEQLKSKSTSSNALKAAEAKIEVLRQQLAANEAQRGILAKEKEKVEALRAENEILKRRTVVSVPKSRGDEPRSGALSRQISALQARLKVLEASKVPYTPEELALFKAPPVQLSVITSGSSDIPKVEAKKETAPPEKRTSTNIRWPWGKGKKPTAGASPEPEVAATVAPAKQQKPAVRALPAGAAPLVAEAQRAFGAGQFDAAEQKYLEVLKMDEKNTVVLANLAAINLQQNHLPQAEERLTAALNIEPADAHLQSLMGILRFRQDKVDEAIDYLSKASVTDPKDSETQNYLGIALSQKGQRGPAENAFRRAIQINPNYAGAHYNLSMAYTTSQPPALELARFHYQKALKLGYPANPAVEKMINGN